MSNKYFAGNKGSYIFCDICGQACYRWEAIKLTSLSGRPGCIVCPNDADAIDYGSQPFTVEAEQSPAFVRINHTNVDNGATPLDYDTSEDLGV